MNFTECTWDTVPDIWDQTSRLWDSVCPFIEEVLGVGGSAGAEEAVRAYEKLDKQRKRRVLRLIMHYRGLEYSQQREVRDDLEVTTEDMQLLLEKYGEWKRQREMKVTVNEIKVE